VAKKNEFWFVGCADAATEESRRFKSQSAATRAANEWLKKNPSGFTQTCETDGVNVEVVQVGYGAKHSFIK
jgi:hypothetical protein